jgi:hypothetical protein
MSGKKSFLINNDYLMQSNKFQLLTLAYVRESTLSLRCKSDIYVMTIFLLDLSISINILKNYSIIINYEIKC